jgi:hypothetical protein
MRANRDFWNAVGGSLRPALDYSITASLSYQPPAESVQMTTAQFSLVPPPFHQPSSPAPPRVAIAGTVWNSASPPQPIAGVWVRVQETGQTDVTDGNGQFRIAALAPGTYTLAARTAGFADATSLPLKIPPPLRPVGSPPALFGYYDLQMTPS